MGTHNSIVKGKSLRQNTYHGIILPDEDPKNMGRYKVHLPELKPLLTRDEGIWVKNQNHKWRYTPSTHYMYGQYHPIQPGTLVLVRFYEDDLNTGYIERIVSDQQEKTQPQVGVDKEPKSIKDRDDFHVIFKTPRYHNALYILEDTTDGDTGLTKKLIPNSIHLYYNMHRTSMIINECGIHWFTMDSYGKTVIGDYAKWVLGDYSRFIGGKTNIVTTHDFFRGNNMNTHCTSGLEQRYHSEKQGSQTSNEKITEDAPTIWMNSGKSKDAEGARTTSGEAEIDWPSRIISKPFPTPIDDRPKVDMAEDYTADKKGCKANISPASTSFPESSDGDMQGKYS